MKIIRLLALLIFWFVSASFAHPFHVSITKAIFNEKTQSLEVSMRFFTDDLSLCTKTNLDKETPSAASDTLVKKYIQQHFKIYNTEGEALPAIYIGAKTDFDLTYIFIEYENFPLFKTYSIQYNCFFEQFEDQSNMLSMDIKKQKASAYFTTSKPINTVTL